MKNRKSSQQENAFFNEQESPIGLIPDELWIRTFSFFSSRNELSKVGLACRRFHQLTSDIILLDAIHKPIYSKVVSQKKASAMEIACIALSPDGYRIAGASSADCKMHIWDMQAKQVKQVNSNHRYDAIAYTKDGQFIVANSSEANGIIDVWDTEGYQKVSTLENIIQQDKPSFLITLNNNQFIVDHCEVDSSTQNPRALSTIKRCDLKKGEIITHYPAEAGSHLLSVARDEKKVVCSQDKKIMIFDLETGAELVSWETSFKVRHAELVAGNKIIYAGFSNEIHVRNLASGEDSVLYTLESASYCTHFAVSRNGRFLAIPDDDKVKMWDIQQAPYSCISTVKLNDMVASSLYFNPLSDKLIAHYGDGLSVCVFDVLKQEQQLAEAENKEEQKPSQPSEPKNKPNKEEKKSTCRIC